PVCKLLTGKTDTADIRKQIEGAQGLLAMDARDTVEAVHKNIAPSPELPDHILGNLLTLGRERFHRGVLCEGSRARNSIVNEKIDGWNGVLRHNAVAKPPAGHRIDFREPVDVKEPIEDIRNIQ